MTEYLLFCDESEKRGIKYSNFYGGLLVSSKDYAEAVRRLEAKLLVLNVGQEVKWSKVSDAYLTKYQELMTEFFDLIRERKIKVRIMFTSNRIEPLGLTKEQRRSEYFLLYYQFIKHAFGLRFCPKEGHPIYLRVFLDELPDKREHCSAFKAFIKGLENTFAFRQVPIRIRESDIVEVDSKDHVLLQCLDVVLGSMAFRLNEKHLVKVAGSARRGAKTIAKEKLYRHISQEIRTLRPGFNIGITTGVDGLGLVPLWTQPYRHWLFMPRQRRIL